MRIGYSGNCDANTGRLLYCPPLWLHSSMVKDFNVDFGSTLPIIIYDDTANFNKINPAISSDLYLIDCIQSFTLQETTVGSAGSTVALPITSRKAEYTVDTTKGGTFTFKLTATSVDGVS